MRKDYGRIFKHLVEHEGYELLSKYINSYIKVKIRCDKGHEYNVTPNSFKNGSRCPKCPSKYTIQAKKQFKELVDQEGYELLSDYKNTITKVKLKCPEGHEYSVKPIKFKSGRRCPKCSGKCSEYAKEQFIQTLDQEGYELLSGYIDMKTKVVLLCSNGHIVTSRPDHFKRGVRCPKCTGLCPIQAKEQFIQTLDQEGYKLLSDYNGIMYNVMLLCPNGHEWEVTPNNFKTHYRRCSHCSGSTGQRLLQEKLKEHIKEDVIYNDRKVLNGLELDIYYPDLKIAIEYQGNYWHSRLEQIVRDKRKKKLCEEKGIKLIEVWDNDFLKDKNKIVNKLIKELN